MSTIIYLANQRVQIVTGEVKNNKINVSKCYVEDAPDGCIINGIVMDSESFVDFLKKTWETNKLPKNKIILVVNSSKFVGKNIELPKMNDQKTLEYIIREFSDIKKSDEEVIGYVDLLSTKNTSKVYAQSVPAEMLNDYMDMFSEAGISLEAIYSGESSIISLVAAVTKNVSSTFVYIIADKMTLTTILWIDGSFYYLNSVRSFYEQGTPEYANDVSRSVSQIIQFMQAHQINHELELVIMSGFDLEHMSMYENAIRQQGVNVPVTNLNGAKYGIIGSENDINLCINGISGLLCKGKKQNYIKNYSVSQKKNKGDKKSYKEIIMIGVTFLVMCIALGVSITLKIVNKKQLKEIKDYNDSVNVSLYDMLQQENDKLLVQYEELKGINENIYTYPVGNDQVINVVKNCAGTIAEVDFDDFDANKGVLTFSARCDTVDNINVFIEKLNSRDEFYKVDYTGYSFVDAIDKWDVHVVCTLSESVGR